MSALPLTKLLPSPPAPAVGCVPGEAAGKVLSFQALMMGALAKVPVGANDGGTGKGASGVPVNAPLHVVGACAVVGGHLEARGVGGKGPHFGDDSRGCRTQEGGPGS